MVDSASPAPADEPITVFDAAHYIYELTGELGRMAREAGLQELAEHLERARSMAAEAMHQARRPVADAPPADDLTGYDAAARAYKLSGQFERLAREGGLTDLAGQLQRTGAAAAQAMATLRDQPEG